MHQQIRNKCSAFLALLPLFLSKYEAFIIPTTPALLKTRLPSNSFIVPPQQSPSSLKSTVLSAKKKKKGSMAEKRKKRARRLPPRQVVRPSVLENDTPIDQWETTTATGVIQPATKEEETSAPPPPSPPKEEEEEEEKSAEEKKAAQLIESQRKSVDTLTYVREKVESLPYDKIVSSLKENNNRGYYIIDNFLGDELSSEMSAESTSMLQSDKLELDVTHIGSGEYVSEIKGGQDQYADCPRCVEFVVSLTRFMPPKLDVEKVISSIQTLDATASMASLRAFDRKARLSSLELLSPGADEPPRPFGYANGGDDDDARKVTVLYFLTPSDWTEECGGGVTVRTVGDEDGGVSSEGDVLIEAKKDRLVIFRSDTCLLRMNIWEGTDELMNAGCLATHLVKARS